MVDVADQSGLEPVAQPVTDDPAPAQLPADKWSSALVLVGAATAAAGEKRGIVVCEARADDGSGTLAGVKYAQNGDIYFRMDPDCDFGAKNDGALTLGVNVDQGLTRGLSVTPGVVHIGPAHPVFGALNLATLQGATSVEVRGLSDAWKKTLQPAFDDIAKSPWLPNAVAIKLT